MLTTNVTTHQRKRSRWQIIQPNPTTRRITNTRGWCTLNIILAHNNSSLQEVLKPVNFTGRFVEAKGLEPLKVFVRGKPVSVYRPQNLGQVDRNTIYLNTILNRQTSQTIHKPHQHTIGADKTTIMGKIIHHKGNIFNSTAPALCQGVNTKGIMGAGIARPFKKRYPEMYLNYKKACKTRSLTPGSVHIWNQPNGPTIYNIASQDRPGPHARVTWLTTGLHTTLKDADQQGHTRIALKTV